MFSPEKTETLQKGGVPQRCLVLRHLLSFPRRAEGIHREGVFHADVQTNSRQILAPLRHTQRQRPVGVTRAAVRGTVAKRGFRTLGTLEPQINDELRSGG